MEQMTSEAAIEVATTTTCSIERSVSVEVVKMGVTRTDVNTDRVVEVHVGGTSIQETEIRTAVRTIDTTTTAVAIEVESGIGIATNVREDDQFDSITIDGLSARLLPLSKDYRDSVMS